MAYTKVYLLDGTQVTYKGELDGYIYIEEQEVPIKREECIICAPTGMYVQENGMLLPVYSGDILSLPVERRNAATHSCTNQQHGMELLNMIVFYHKRTAAYRVSPANRKEYEAMKAPRGTERYAQEVYYKPFLSAYGVGGIIHNERVGNKVQTPNLCEEVAL